MNINELWLCSFFFSLICLFFLSDQQFHRVYWDFLFSLICLFFLSDQLLHWAYWNLLLWQFGKCCEIIASLYALLLIIIHVFNCLLILIGPFDLEFVVFGKNYFGQVIYFERFVLALLNRSRFFMFLTQSSKWFHFKSIFAVLTAVCPCIWTRPSRSRSFTLSFTLITVFFQRLSSLSRRYLKILSCKLRFLFYIC